MKYIPFWGGPTSPKKKKGGVPLALSLVEGSQERNGAGSFLVVATVLTRNPLAIPRPRAESPP